MKNYCKFDRLGLLSLRLPLRWIEASVTLLIFLSSIAAITGVGYRLITPL